MVQSSLRVNLVILVELEPSVRERTTRNIKFFYTKIKLILF